MSLINTAQDINERPPESSHTQIETSIILPTVPFVEIENYGIQKLDISTNLGLDGETLNQLRDINSLNEDAKETLNELKGQSAAIYGLATK